MTVDLFYYIVDLYVYSICTTKINFFLEVKTIYIESFYRFNDYYNTERKRWSKWNK